MKAFTLIFLTLFLSYSTHLYAAKKVYNLDIQVLNNGKLIATPQIVVQEGKVGTIKTNVNGVIGQFNVVAYENNLKGQQGILMKFDVKLQNKNPSQTVEFRPSLLVKEGQEASLTIDKEQKLTLKVKAHQKVY